MLNRINFCGIFLTILSTYVCASAPAQVAKTGEIGGATGSDAGVAWPNPRFVVGKGAESDCVRDNLTGLFWVRDLNTVSINGAEPGSLTTWSNALASIASINSGNGYCGHNNWRLPNKLELKSLVNYGSSDPVAWLTTQGFSNVQSRSYWSSTTYASGLSAAWTVYFTNLPVGPTILSMVKTNYAYVWPVSGGQ